MRIGLLCAVAALGLAACSKTTPPESLPTTSGSVTVTSPTETSAAANDDPSVQAASGKSTKQTSTSSSRSTSTTTSTPPPPAATVTLSVVKQPSCPVHGTPEAPFSSPGNPVTISWKVTGANGAALAVDNPTLYGAYGMYGATGQMEFSFGCDTKPGKTSHTYTVWPAGFKNISKTITVSATNNP